MTASPGADEDKIKTVCSNLFLNEVIVKTEKDPDVRPYLKPIRIEWVRVKMKPELEEIRDLLKKVLKDAAEDAQEPWSHRDCECG